MLTKERISQPVIIFDGVCNLCSSVVQFIIKKDKDDVFRFASLQSEYGQSILQKFSLPQNNFGSFILYKNGNIYTKSTGALLVAKQLHGVWRLMSAFLIVPRFIRDAVYALVAKNRYKWFGKKTECWLPTPTLRSKFFEKISDAN